MSKYPAATFAGILPFTLNPFPFYLLPMSDETKPYNQLYIQAWTILSSIVAVILFAAFVFGPRLLHTGHWIWDLLRYLASPII